MAFMSHYGMAHAIVPKDIAEDVGELFPDWIRVFQKMGVLSEGPPSNRVECSLYTF
jgi:hypothetical protein